MTLPLVMALAYTVAAPATVGFFYLTKREREDPTTILSLLFVSAFLFELVATFARIYFNNNMLILNLSSLVEGWFILYLLRSLLSSRVSPSYLYLFPAGAFIITCVAALELLFKGVQFFNVSYTLKNVLVVTGILAVCFEVAKGLNMPRWLYYILGTYLFYFCSSFIFFLVVSPTLNMDILRFLYDIHNSINALINLFFGFALWKLSTTKSSLSPLLF